MTEITDNQPPIDTDALLLMLRRKERNWVEWGKACQQLQKAGLKPQEIFEATGFELSSKIKLLLVPKFLIA